jgi:bifunctional polynucleotide phosphatase/kinase
MTWIEKDNFLYLNYLNSKSRKECIGFDLDGTIINFGGKTEKFSFINDKICNYIRNLYKKKYEIIIFSNQYGITKKIISKDIFKLKIENIVKKINIPIKFICSIKKDYMRKPSIGMYDYIFNVKNYKKTKLKIYYGDAGGRYNDFSDSDLKFANNIGCVFIHINDFINNKKNNCIPKITYLI